MKKMVSYVYIILGSILIGAGFDLFFRMSQIIPSGILGLTSVLEIKFNIDMVILLAVFNSLSFLIGVIFLPEKDYKKYVLSAILVPLSILVFKDIRNYVDLSDANELINTIFGAGIIGYGFKLIYKEDGDVTGIDVLESVAFENVLHSKKIVTYMLDIFLLLVSYTTSGLESTLYTVISILIIEYMSKSGMLNSSDTKVFYIITNNDDEVKYYIMNELNCVLTIFDVV